MSEIVSEFVARLPHPRLRSFVTEYVGYRLDGMEPASHAGLPSRSLTLIVAFDDVLDVEHVTRTGVVRDGYWAMLGGLHTTPAVIHHPGRQHGVQLRLTPRGALGLLGVPAGAVSHDVVHLADVLGEATHELIDRLSSSPSWSARWAVLDDVLLRIVDDDVVIRDQADHAWSLLVASDGDLGISELAETIGWSRRHLATVFKQAYGLSPKSVARIVRFERAQRLLRLPTRPDLASVAAVCGYADQSHMTREWNEFSGTSPTKWLIDESIPFVQDDDAGELPR